MGSSRILARKVLKVMVKNLRNGIVVGMRISLLPWKPQTVHKSQQAVSTCRTGPRLHLLFVLKVTLVSPSGHKKPAEFVLTQGVPATGLLSQRTAALLECPRATSLAFCFFPHTASLTAIFSSVLFSSYLFLA